MGHRYAAPILLLASVAVASGWIARAEAPTPSGAPPPDSAGAPDHAPIIQHPPTLGTVDAGQRDAAGRPIGVACATCHAPGSAEAMAAREGVPENFHGEITLEHGNLRCGSCHDLADKSRLHLADGEAVEMSDVMRLCGQCHGPQMKAFEHSAHGGSRGWWDARRGPRIRNNCVACHAAHEPAYPLVLPAPPPNDRFLSKQAGAHEE